MAGGEGGDSEWLKALEESTSAIPGDFEKEMKMRGLLGNKGAQGNTKLTANANLIKWLEEEGDVYLSEASSWGEAPHPMAISTETKDEITNESSGRGLLARRDINDGDELLIIPMDLCLTKKSARNALGKDVLPSEINEYLAMACQLIHERFALGEKSFYKPYIDVLPDVNEVNPTFTWSDEDLAFLEGSPVIAATRSLQAKLQREYDALLGGEDGLINKYPGRFPKEVGRSREKMPFVQLACR
jgi:histone-lysine N-methyltransferase SETD3